MQKTVLILGSNGRFGRAAFAAFSWCGWDVRTFDRKTDTLADAAWGADIIVNAWNPAYPDWATQVPKLTAQVIKVAADTGATVIIPGNVYNFGTEMPPVLDEETQQATTGPLGTIRIAMEQAYRDADVRTIILRAGDFIDTQASGNWYDKIITSDITKGKVTYPGPTDIPHAWAYLPDMAECAVALAAMADQLPRFTDVHFPGYTLTGAELHASLEQTLGQRLKLSEMSWWPLQIAKPFWAMAKPLLEMRYLWTTPHEMTGTKLTDLLPDFEPTPLLDALSESLPEDIYPDRTVPRPIGRIRFCCQPVNDYRLTPVASFGGL
jgi:nucleoside-diphosphate-sugar epimerase